jgi:hypothetical protein
MPRQMCGPKSGAPRRSIWFSPRQFQGLGHGFLSSRAASRHLADVECFPLGVQPILEGDDLFHLQPAWHCDLEPVGPEAHGRTLQPVPCGALVQPGLDVAAILVGPQLAGGDERPLEGPTDCCSGRRFPRRYPTARKRPTERIAAGLWPPSVRRLTRPCPSQGWVGPSTCCYPACSVPSSRRRPLW